MTDTGSPSGPATPWGFNEDWGWHDGLFSADLASQQIQQGAAIMPDALSANRFHVQWAEVEEQRGNYDWGHTDGVYDAMQQHAAMPVLLLYNAPVWARDPAATCPSENPCAYPPLSQYDPDWQRFVQAAVSRYPDVRAIEIWNEPNIGRFWAPSADAERYAALLSAAHDAVEAANATAPVVLGGLIPAGTNETNTAASAFLRDVYSAAGPDEFEGIGTHPYPHNAPFVETMWRRLDALRTVRDEAGDSATPLWITEVGVSTDPSSGVALEEQGNVLTQLYRSVEGHDVNSFIIHRLYDIGTEGSYWNQTGVVYQDMVPKPAYCELGAAIGTPCDPPAAPQITDTDPDAPSNSSTTPSVKGNSSADTTTVEVFTQANCQGSPVSGSKSAFEGTGIATSVAANSTTQLSARARDAAGNTSACSSNFAYTHDNQAPSVSVQSGPSGPTNNSSPSFGFSAEAGSGVVCSIDTGTPSFGPCSGASSHSASSLSDGSYTFRVKATDAAGNSDESTRSFTVDTQAPGALAITDTDPDSPANDNNPEAKGTAETGSTVRIYSSADCSGTPLATGSASTFASPGIGIAVPDNSTTQLRATATDAAGNTSSCSANFPYQEVTPPSDVDGDGVPDASDSCPFQPGPASNAGCPVPQPPPDPGEGGGDTAPEAVITKGPPTKSKSKTATFEFSANEPAASFECKLDSGAFAPCTSPKSFSGLKKGSHTFEVRAKDASGNVDSTPAVQTWIVKKKKKK